VLSPSLDTVRLFVHVLAASVWVGGQIVLGGLVPTVRAHDRSALPLVARAFARVAWPAFAVTVITGVWGLVVIDVSGTSNAYQATLLIKILVVAVSGVAAAVHQIGTSKLALALGGALGLVAGLGAMFLGILLRTGT
jgi:putative copper export protein